MVDILPTSFRSAPRPGGPPLDSLLCDASRPRSAPFLPRRSGAHDDKLARVIEGEIIPRLMLAQGGLPVRPRILTDGAVAVSPEALDTFTRLTLAYEAAPLVDHVVTLMGGGVSLRGVYLDLLAATARRLGDDWNDDLVSFTDVTVGLSRLQQVVRELGRRFPAREPDAAARAVHLAPAPGEQHAFGLVLLEDGFRRAGWRTSLDTGATADDVVRTVAAEWFDVVGLSATSDTPPAPIASLIAEVRRASRNPRLFVMAGGRLFVDDPGLARELGADATAATAADALSIADEAVKPRAFA